MQPVWYTFLLLNAEMKREKHFDKTQICRSIISTSDYRKGGSVTGFQHLFEQPKYIFMGQET